MDRIERLRAHLRTSLPSTDTPAHGVFLSPRDASLSSDVYAAVLTPNAVRFVTQLAKHFAPDVEHMQVERKTRRLRAEQDPRSAFPTFLESTRPIREDTTWTVDPLPPALHDRRVDIGDVAPCDKRFLLRALNSKAQGVQVDFDDGNCPTWKNTLLGHAHIMDAVRGNLQFGSERMAPSPALLLIRPRAWNMDEMNMIIDGRVVPSALFDFALHLFHNGRLLHEQGRGPYLYLPKLEGYKEAALWRRIFEFTERQLGLPSGSIKATVLIENIYAAFEMDEILYELRHHSAGLNCGMWDYTASIVVNFRLHDQCVLPDRQRFVSMQSPFLQHYMELLIQTCKRRQALATTGMVPFVLDQLPPELTKADAIDKAKQGKHLEALAGSDGALVYDVELVKPIQEVFRNVHASGVVQRKSDAFYEATLITLPQGQVTLSSVHLNLNVALSYVLAWFRGHGTCVVNGCVEDSATAEISRAQLWQWIYHAIPLADTTPDSKQTTVSASLVHEMLMEISREKLAIAPLRHVVAALNLVFRVVTTRTPPAFLTTFLLEQEPLTRSLEE